MTVKELISEIIQAVVALVLLGPTVFIVSYQTINRMPVQVPDILATLDGAIVAFYFRGVQIQATARAITSAVTAAIPGGK